MKKETQQENFLMMLHQCEGTIFRICYLFSDRCSESISDLYQEIAYNLWMHYPEFRGQSAENTWVYRVALNTVRQLYRKRRKVPVFVQFDPEAFENYVDDSSNSLLERLYELIDRLSPKEKELIFLYLDGVPIKEITTLTKCSKPTVMRKLSNIKQLLIQFNQNDEQ